jgi:hypothetical protein
MICLCLYTYTIEIEYDLPICSYNIYIKIILWNVLKIWGDGRLKFKMLDVFSTASTEFYFSILKGVKFERKKSIIFI